MTHTDKNHRIPLGGIGAGCLKIDGNGRLYSDIAYPFGENTSMPDSLVAIRLQNARGNVYSRLLCGAGQSEYVSHPPPCPPALEARELKQNVNYPIVTYELRDEYAPAKVVWSYFSPLIPFDHVASIMPAVFLGIRVTNPARFPLACSLLVNLDTTAFQKLPTEIASVPPIYAINIMPVDESRDHFDQTKSRGAVAKTAAETFSGTYPRNALLFGDRRATGGPQPQLCLAATQYPNVAITLTHWDPHADRSRARFWKHFVDTGRVLPPQEEEPAHAGALCLTAKLAAGASHRFDFILSWHIPPRLCETIGLVNGYAQSFPCAPSTGRYGLKHLAYLFSAINKWHKQLTASSLPPPLVTALMSVTQSLLTHTRHETQGGFRFFAAKSSENAPQPDWDVHAALALLLFAPRFHSAAVSSCLASLSTTTRSEEMSHEDMRMRAELVLSAYADILFTGNRARLLEWYPRLMAISQVWVDAVTAETIPSGASPRPFPVEVLGLWAVALDALAQMARHTNDTQAYHNCQRAADFLALQYKNQLSQLTTINNTKNTVSNQFALWAALRGPCTAELLQLTSAASPAQLQEAANSDSPLSPTAAVTEQQYVQHATTALMTHALYGAHVQNGANDTMKSLGACHDHFFSDILKNFSSLSANMLGLWSVLQALTGVAYDALNNALYIRLSALTVRNGTLPVFTPVCLGTLSTTMKQSPHTSIQLRLTLETPLTINIATLNLPGEINAAKVTCLHDTDTISLSHQVTPEPGRTMIHIHFKTPLKLSSTLIFRIRETPVHQASQSDR